MNDGNSNAR